MSETPTKPGKSIAGQYRSTLASTASSRGMTRLTAVLIVERDNAWSVRFVVDVGRGALPLDYEHEHTGLSAAIRDYEVRGGELA